MAELEELKRGVEVKGILLQQEVTVVGVTWHGTAAVDLTYKRPDGQTGNQLLFRSDQDTIEVVQSRRIWTFSGDGDLLRLVAEAYRIHPAHLNDESELVRSMAAWALGGLESERAAMPGVDAQVIVRRGRLHAELVAATRELGVTLIVLGRPLGETAVFERETLLAFAPAPEAQTGIEVRLV